MKELPASTPSLRLLADQTSTVLRGISDALNGLALLLSAPVDRSPERRSAQIRVPDFAPALVSVARSFLVVGAITLLWIFTQWPSGGLALTFSAIVVNLFSARADEAYATAVDAVAGVVFGMLLAAVLNSRFCQGLKPSRAWR